MLVRKAFQFRLQPSASQRMAMAMAAGCVRLVWNKSLGELKEALDRGEKYAGYVPMASLNKAILDQGWYQFRQMLIYKQEWLGGRVILVSAKYTSQKCSACGHTSSENRKTQAEFACVNCGYMDHADKNASINIKAAGSAVLASGEKSAMASTISSSMASAQESPSSEARMSG